MSLNARDTWYVKSRKTAEIRHATKLLVRSGKVPKCERIKITLHYQPKDRRRRDVINLIPTLKAAEDGIVEAGVIPDDTDQYSEPTMPVLHEPVAGQKRGKIWLVIERLA